MNKTVKTSFAIVLSAGALVACNKLQWMVKYQDQDPYYSFSPVTTVDAEGNAFIGGYIDARPESGDQRTSFIAKYDRAGQLLWDRRFEPHETQGSVHGVRGLLADPQGNLYVAEPRWLSGNTDIGLQITKFNAAGEQLWQRYDEDANLYSWKMPMYFGGDGNIYVRGTWIGAGHLLSISPDGDFRWLEPVAVSSGPGGDGDHGDLPEFGTTQQNLTINADFDWVVASAGLRIIDRQANTLAEFTPEAMGLTTVTGAEILGNNLVVFGSSGNLQKVARLIRSTSSGFVIDDAKRLDLSTVLPNVMMQTLSRFDDQGICFASRNTDLSLTTGYIDAELNLVWTNTRATLRHEFPVEIMSVVGAENACYTQYAESQADQQLASVVLIENVSTGQQKEMISVKDFAAHDLAVHGNDVYQTGITGPYSDTEGTAATLSKHVIN